MQCCYKNKKGNMEFRKKVYVLENQEVRVCIKIQRLSLITDHNFLQRLLNKLFATIIELIDRLKRSKILTPELNIIKEKRWQCQTH